MDNKELGRLMRLSQSNPDLNQQKALASHFGIVAGELLVAREFEASLRRWFEGASLDVQTIAELEEFFGRKDGRATQKGG